jgi:hypothetical protein
MIVGTPKRRTRVSNASKILFALLCTLLLVAAENPWVGTWKLDPAKSKLGSHPKTAKETTVMVRDLGNRTMEVTLKGTANDGTPISRKYTTSQDGGPTKFLEGAPPAGIDENVTVVNDKVRDSAMTRGGKTISTSHLVMSDDEKSFTIVTKGMTPDGKPLDQDQKAVFEKQ